MSYQREDWRELLPHPAADIFPLLTDTELAEWVGHARVFGYDQSEPIRLYEGKILDGRNRHRMCELADIKPWFEDYEGDEPIAFVIRENLHRRHLNASQRALAATSAWDLYEPEMKRRQQEHGNTAPGKPKTLEVNLPQVIDKPKRDPQRNALIGQQFGIGASYVDRARRLKSEAPELLPAVKAGDLSLHSAWKQHTGRIRAEEKAKANETEMKEEARREKRRQRDEKKYAQKYEVPPVKEGEVPFCQTDTYSRIGTYDTEAAKRYITCRADPGVVADHLANLFDRNGMKAFLFALRQYLDADQIDYVFTQYGKERESVGTGQYTAN